ncbi:glycosyltransferase family 2 protein [Patescibacteria group bacterium]|nr:glycosyltransferase family 2 protein [Patescibacteria group bacterium]
MEEINQIYLSVIIPAFNEEKLITNTLMEVNRFLAEKEYGFEIIVIDDGSEDKTSALVMKLQSKINHLKLLQNENNFGKGYSVKRGMLNSQGSYAIFMDADGSTSINHIDNFINSAKDGYDIVIGNRKLKASNIKKRQSLYKEIFGGFGNLLIQALAVPGIKDTQCGFKLFSKEAKRKIFPKLTINGWGFDIETLVLAKKYGFKIKSTSVLWENREATNVKLSDYIKTFQELIIIKINLLRKKYDNEK